MVPAYLFKIMIPDPIKSPDYRFVSKGEWVQSSLSSAYF